MNEDQKTFEDLYQQIVKAENVEDVMPPLNSMRDLYNDTSDKLDHANEDLKAKSERIEGLMDRISDIMIHKDVYQTPEAKDEQDEPEDEGETWNELLNEL